MVITRRASQKTLINPYFLSSQANTDMPNVIIVCASGVPTRISIPPAMLTTLQIQNPTRPAPTQPRPLLSSEIKTQLSVLCPTVPQVNSSKNVAGEGWRPGLEKTRLVYSNKGEAVLRGGMKTTIGRELELSYWVVNVMCSCILVVYR